MATVGAGGVHIQDVDDAVITYSTFNNNTAGSHQLGSADMNNGRSAGGAIFATTSLLQVKGAVHRVCASGKAWILGCRFRFRV